jgi:hypothetical protein
MEFIYRCRGTIPLIDVERGIVMMQALLYQVDVKGAGKIKGEPDCQMVTLCVIELLKSRMDKFLIRKVYMVGRTPNDVELGGGLCITFNEKKFKVQNKGFVPDELLKACAHTAIGGFPSASLLPPKDAVFLAFVGRHVTFRYVTPHFSRLIFPLPFLSFPSPCGYPLLC